MTPKKLKLTALLAAAALSLPLATHAADPAPPKSTLGGSGVTTDELDPATKAAVAKGLDWLAKNINANGGINGQGGDSAGIMGLAGLAFLAEGSMPGDGPHGKEVDKILEFVLSNCQPSGLIASPSDGSPMYGHGFATLFLAEAYGMKPPSAKDLEDPIKGKLENAIRLIVSIQNNENGGTAGGWRYQPIQADADLSVTICQVMALRAARNAGIKVPVNPTINKAIAYVKLSQEADGGFKYMLQSGGSGYARTGAGVACLYYMRSPDSNLDKEIDKGIAYLKQHMPTVNGRGGDNEGHFYYGNYYATQAMFMAGGDAWKAYWPAIRSQLLAKQDKATGVWGDNEGGGAVCSTAMALIMLQVPNRLLPILQKERSLMSSPLSSFVFRLSSFIFLFCITLPTRADWTLTTADQPPLQHLTINTWSPADGLSATDPSSKLISLPTRDIVSLDSGRKIATETSLLHWKLSLRNGDILYGDPNGFKGQSLMFRTEGLTLAIPLKSVATLTTSRADAATQNLAPANSEKDVVRLLNNDLREGIITNISATTLQLGTEGADAPTDIPAATIASISFGGAAPPRTVPLLSVRINFISGTSLSIPLSPDRAFNWTLSTIKFKDSAGTDQTLDDRKLDTIASIDVLGGRIVYLSELDPASEEQTSFLGTKWPMQVNKNVLGQKLTANKIEHAHGLGVHTQSTLVYDLDGTFDTLTLRAALDDSAEPHGQAKASIILDGKILWQSPEMKPGEISPELSLPITGGKRLELHADPASRLDVLGRFDWLDIALRRK